MKLRYLAFIICCIFFYEANVPVEKYKAKTYTKAPAPKPQRRSTQPAKVVEHPIKSQPIEQPKPTHSHHNEGIRVLTNRN